MQYATAAKNARMNALLALLNGGTLELLAANDAIIASFTLDNPAGAISNGVLTLSGFPKTVTSASGGTIAKARFRSAAPADVATNVTVGTSGAEIIVSSLTVSANQDVKVLANPSFTHG